MCLFWFTKWVGWFPSVMAIVLDCKIIIAIAFICYTRLIMKKLQVFFTPIITFSYFINNIVKELLLYMMPIFYNWLSEMRFKLHVKLSSIFCNLMLLPFASRLEMKPISLVQISCPINFTKLMLFASKLLNNFRLLQRWRDVYE